MSLFSWLIKYRLKKGTVPGLLVNKIHVKKGLSQVLCLIKYRVKKGTIPGLTVNKIQVKKGDCPRSHSQ